MSRLQRHNGNFKTGNKFIEETNHYTYLGLNKEPMTYQGKVETELPSLNYCKPYENIRNKYLTKITQIFPDFPRFNDSERLTVILGERKDCCRLAARYIAACMTYITLLDPVPSE